MFIQRIIYSHSLNTPRGPTLGRIIIIVEGDTFCKDLLRYPLAREGVYAPGGPAFLAHAMQRVSNIVGLTALRLAVFMGYG